MKKIDGKKCLQRLAEYLRDYKTPIRPAWADEAQAAIQAFLSGEAETLDAAFGLKPEQRGAPGYPQRNEDIARKIYELRKAGKSWLDIGNDDYFKKKYGVTDLRTLRRYYAEHRIALLSEELEAEFQKEGWGENPP